MRVLITVLDNTTETSMPFNEFVLYRANHYPDEKQVLVICGPKGELPKVTIPENMEIRYAGRDPRKIRRTIKQITEECGKQGIPFVIHMHQVQSGFLAEIAMAGTGLRKKTLFTVHSTFSGYKFHNKFLSFTNVLLAKRTTCVSNTSYLDYPGILKKIKGSRIQAVQNGVDTERIDRFLVPAPDTREDTAVFIYVARLIPLKNHKFLVDVLAKCDDSVRFVFVGEEDGERSVRGRAEERGVADRIEFTGLIPRNDVFRRLQAADYYISSSTLEGLPVSVLEAMYCGLPCVLSDIPQHREVAGDQAVILPPDAGAWAEEINRLAALGREERQRLSASVKQYVADHFSLDSMHRQYDLIYDQLR